jgi:hypothetical protein
MSIEGDREPVAVPAEPGGSAPAADAALSARLRRFVSAVRDGDEKMVEETLMRLSQSRRWLAPLAFVVGGFAMLFTGLKLLFSNWRLTLIQVLPAMWIWLATYDLKAHALHGKSFHVLRGPILIPILLVIAAITAASFFLNAVFGFAIVQSGTPKVRPAMEQARSHIGVILGSGTVVGLLLGFATLIVTRWGRPWFGISLSVVLAIMMISYVAVPSRLIGAKPTGTRRDKLTASAVGGALGAVVCTPPYVLGRIGILMLGSKALLIPGIIVVAVGATLQAAATGAVKTVKMSAKLLAADPQMAQGGPVPADPAGRPGPARTRQLD